MRDFLPFKVCLSLALCCVFHFLGNPIAFGQATGQISGVVSDSSGSVVPKAVVTITNSETSESRNVLAGADGFYVAPLMNPGIYKIEAGLAGFKTTVRDGIQVTVNGTARVDFSLAVGATRDQVTVTSGQSLIQTDDSTLGIVVDHAKIIDLPLNGRNFTQLGTLIPGVLAPPASLGGSDGNATVGGASPNTTGFSVNGQRNQSNSFELDGADNNDTFNSGFVLRPPPDAIQEFKILTHSYAAEYGRNAGSIVNVVTKEGTNEFHGAAWEFNRNSVMQAKNYFATQKPALNQNQFGATLGAPVIKDRLFAFGFYEGFRNTQGETQTVPVLTALERSGNFGSNTIIDPTTGVAFANNTIPTSRINTIATNLLNTYIPLPNAGGTSYTKSPSTLDDRDQFGIRLDYNVNSKHTLLGRYMYGRQNASDPLAPSNFAPVSNQAHFLLQDSMLSDTWILRSNMVNVARMNDNRISGTPNSMSGINATTLGFQYSASNPVGAGVPFMTVAGFFTAGDNQFDFAQRTNNTISMTDDFTWIFGKHSIKIGGEIDHQSMGIAFINRPNGDFTFTGQYTGNAAADFLLGFPAQFRQASGDPNLNGTAWSYAIYAQDEFRLTSRLTLNYGLRYEVSPPFVDALNHLNAFHTGQQSTINPDAPTGLVFPGDKGVPRGTYSTDYGNVAPRLAATWDPTGKGTTNIRAAWGIFYDTTPGQGNFFQNGTLAAPYQYLTQLDLPLDQQT
ncbi:TonB-dependent receptor [Granulicella arctica]|uniref:Outer membrane receptor protein involved in Fe transport n=1 Tax=Granulicella arctica TaxID=940613 RepID=A0A7Y9PJI5_9BACT|nr:carboxypeptidase regulatory-like domain-containing protein [Granulicella arctica]NYF80238.1 outer membrane receptor protein involved in Fe transport [Granulicella arctica]